jgi:hypothetical protein
MNVEITQILLYSGALIIGCNTVLANLSSIILIVPNFVSIQIMAIGSWILASD